MCGAFALKESMDESRENCTLSETSAVSLVCESPSATENNSP